MKLTDEQIEEALVNLGRGGWGPYEDGFVEGVAFAEMHHGIEAAVLAQGEPVEQHRAQLQMLVASMSQLVDDHKALLAKTLPALIRLGDFVGNVDEGGASGLGRIDRCALILEVKNAIK